MDSHTWNTTTGYTVNDKYGYMFTTDDVFSIDKKLNSASLSEVPINVYNSHTGKTENVKVTADWTSTGEIQKGTSTYVSTSGGYRFKSTSMSDSRTAIATGSVNNKDLGQNIDGEFSKFKSATIEMKNNQKKN
jgi:hypothetical protein